MSRGFPENDWPGHEITIGRSLRLRVTAAAGRCVMTTLAQGGLPRRGILRVLAEHNDARAGGYAGVLDGGTVMRGDAIGVT